MGWNLEGLTVLGLYLETFPVCGKVTNSRVKYGGEVQHTVVLDNPTKIFNSTRVRILLDHKEVLKVMSDG